MSKPSTKRISDILSTKYRGKPVTKESKKQIKKDILDWWVKEVAKDKVPYSTFKIIEGEESATGIYNLYYKGKHLGYVRFYYKDLKYTHFNDCWILSCRSGASLRTLRYEDKVIEEEKLTLDVCKCLMKHYKLNRQQVFKMLQVVGRQGDAVWLFSEGMESWLDDFKVDSKAAE